MMNEKPYELLNHTSDLKFRVVGEDLYRLFENAGFALFDVISEMKYINQCEYHHICVKGEDINFLLKDWLGELLYLNQADDFLFSGFKIDYIRDHELKGKAYGEKFNPEKHIILTEIKAITYHELEVKKENGIFTATFIADI